MPTFTTRVNINNTNQGANGRHRVGDLIADAAGGLSGMTALGGENDDGTVFYIPSIDGSDASMPTSFDGTEGAYPDAGLTADAAGDLFGTTTGYGGAAGRRWHDVRTERHRVSGDGFRDAGSVGRRQ